MITIIRITQDHERLTIHFSDRTLKRIYLDTARAEALAGAINAGLRQLDPERMSNQGASINDTVAVKPVPQWTRGEHDVHHASSGRRWPTELDRRELEQADMADVGRVERELKYNAFPDRPASDVVATARAMDRAPLDYDARPLWAGDVGGARKSDIAESVNGAWNRAIDNVNRERAMDRFWVLTAFCVSTAIGLAVVARWLVELIW